MTVRWAYSTLFLFVLILPKIEKKKAYTFLQIIQTLRQSDNRQVYEDLGGK